DGDGDLDAFAVNRTAASHTVWLNDGTGAFTDNAQNLATDTSFDGAIGDLDGDGDLDVLVSNFNSADQIWLNDGSGNFTAGPTLTTTGNSLVVELADVDSDGDLDAITGAGFEELWINQGGIQAGTEGAFVISANAFGTLSRITTDISPADVDGDGDIDVVFSYSNNVNTVHLNQGGLQGGTEGQFASGTNFGAVSVTSLELGDLDGDGDVDAFVSRGTSTFNALPSQVFLNDGLGTFTDSGQSLVGNVGEQTRDVKLGDVDNDGDLDAFLATFNDNEIFLNDGSGSFTDSGLAIGGVTDYDNYAVALGDVDGDGFLDAFAGGGTNKLWINDPILEYTSGTINVAATAFVDDVTLTGDDITVSGTVTSTAGLTFLADSFTTTENIEVDNGLTISTTGDVLVTNGAFVTGDSDANGVGAISFTSDSDLSGAGNITGTDTSNIHGATVDLVGYNVSTSGLRAFAGDLNVTAANNASQAKYTTSPTNITITANNNVSMPGGTHFNQVMDADIDNNGSGDVTITADFDNDGNGSFTSSANVNHRIFGANVILTGASIATSVITAKSGSVTLTATTGDVVLGNRAIDSANDLNVNAASGLVVQNTGGTMTLGGALNVTSADGLTVNGTIPSGYTVPTGNTLGGSGTIIGSVTAQSGSAVAPGNSPGILNTGDFDLQLGSTLEIELGGTTAGNTATDHDQVNVTGTVTLGGTLDVVNFGGFTSSLNDTFVIINNDGTDAVSGIFAGLAEGDTFVADGSLYSITYAGGTDSNDVVLTSLGGGFEVINTNDTGAGSLRDAITNANAQAGTDTIVFNIPGAGPHSISPATALPEITEAVVIDGFSEPNASPNTLAVGNDASLEIVLEGTTLDGTGAYGLDIAASNSSVRGIVFSGWGDVTWGGAIEIDAAANNVTIGGNYIGTDAVGTTPTGGRFGVSVFGGSGHVIGGATVADRNVISGNDSAVTFWGGTNSTVSGNYIGVTPDGTTGLLNGSDGVWVTSGAGDITIGGSTVAQRNVISGNNSNGVFVEGGTVTVTGNYIGTNATGAAAIPNDIDGVRIVGGTNHQVGGTLAGEGNVISGNSSDGIELSNVDGVTIQGNHIGVDASGATGLGNGDDGILVSSTSPIIRNNVISNNAGDGIEITGAGNGIDDSAVLWLKGENDFTDEVASNDGTNVGGVTFGVGVDGGQAFEFNGTSQHIEITDDPSLTVTDAITVEAWINPDTLTGGSSTFHPIVSKYNAQANAVSWLFTAKGDGGLYFSASSDGTAGLTTLRIVETSVPVLTLGQYQHVAVTFDTVTQDVQIYVDGVPVPTTVTRNA
ncbi:MAG: FG-GAP-like repeat-containing protein, partial [Pirellulaceae bacterium]